MAKKSTTTATKKTPAKPKAKAPGKKTSTPVSTGPDNYSIRAGAGCGKSTTLQWLETGVPKGITPSEQQQAIFDSVNAGISVAARKKMSVRVACFNTSIMEELVPKFPDADVRNNHKIGFACFKQATGFRGGKYAIDGRKMQYIAKDLIGDPYKDKKLWPIISTAIKLVDMAKLTLTGVPFKAPDGQMRWDMDQYEIEKMAMFYSIDIEDGEALKHVQDLMNRSIEISNYKIDFNDMVFLPNVFGCKPEKVDRLYIDECFPQGTLVETHLGPMPIDKIANNPDIDWKVRSCNLEDKTLTWSSVNKAYRTPTENPLVEVHCGEEKIRCTANHPFRTQRGWVQAGLLREGDSLFYLRDTDSQATEDLQQKVHGAMASAKSCDTFPRSGEEASRENITDDEKDMSPRNGNSIQSYGASRRSTESIEIAKSYGAQTADPGGKWEGSDQTSISVVQGVSGTSARLAMVPRTCHTYWDASVSQKAQVSDVLQSGHCFNRKEDCGRNRWDESQLNRKAKTGSEERKIIDFKKVDRITVSQFHDHELSEDCGEGNRKYVYTLNVENGNYFAGSFLVKNCQDLNAAQQGLLLGTAEQYVIVGDIFQAIYGFAGADPESIPRFESATDAKQLPLTMTRRCPHSHVEMARNFLPPDFGAMFQATPDAPEGTVQRLRTDLSFYEGLIGTSNLCLSRTNAPMVRQCFSLWKANIAARIRGRDIASNLAAVIKRMKADDNITLITKLHEDYEPKIERLRSTDKHDLAEAKQDELEILVSFAEESETPSDAVDNLFAMFDDKERLANAIQFSSVHKAKGLEADNIVIMKPSTMPHPGLCKMGTFWQQQEYNIAYVGHTRGKSAMYIDDESSSTRV